MHTRRPRAHQSQSVSIPGAHRKNETQMFSDHDETSFVWNMEFSLENLRGVFFRKLTRDKMLALHSKTKELETSP